MYPKTSNYFAQKSDQAALDDEEEICQYYQISMNNIEIPILKYTACIFKLL